MAADRRTGSRLVLTGVAAVVVCLGMTITAAGAGPPSPSEGPPDGNPELDLTIGAALDGDIAGVDAQAVGDFGMGGAMEVQVRVANATETPLELTVPAGTILETQDPAEQSVVVAPPDYAQVSADGSEAGTATLIAAPGQTTFELTAYCAQQNDLGPFGPARLSYAGVARDPLPQVLENIAAADPPEGVAQDAVWWVTDDPYVPVADPQLASLLQGVDTHDFAGSPTEVVPDDAYTPTWDGGSSALTAFESPPGIEPDGSGLTLAGLAALAILVVIVGGGVWLALRKPARTQPAWVTGVRSPGWYPDPSGGPGRRFWDGRQWTGHTADD